MDEKPSTLIGLDNGPRNFIIHLINSSFQYVLIMLAGNILIN